MLSRRNCAQVLHALLRTTDCLMKVAVHLKANVLEWVESKHQDALRTAKSQIQSALLEKTGLRWDLADVTGNNGNTTTGNVARIMLHNRPTRKVIEDEVPDEYRTLFPFWVKISQLLSASCPQRNRSTSTKFI